MIVSKRRFNLDVSKIKMPLLGSSKVFKRQFEAASFKRCASIIKTIAKERNWTVIPASQNIKTISDQIKETLRNNFSTNK